MKVHFFLLEVSTMKVLKLLLLMIITLVQSAPMKLDTELRIIVTTTINAQNKNLQLQTMFNQQTFVNRGNPIISLHMLDDNLQHKQLTPNAAAPNGALLPETPIKTGAPQVDDMAKWNTRMEQGGILAGIVGVGETAVNVLAKLIPDSFKKTVTATASDITVTTVTPVTNVIKQTISVESK